MGVERDSLRKVFINNNKAYEEILEGRDLNFIKHYGSKRIKYPTPTQMNNLNIENHYWTLGDRYWKLASQYYDDVSAWWVIGWFNQKPTEAHVQTGDLIMIPRPLEYVYQILGI